LSLRPSWYLFWLHSPPLEEMNDFYAVCAIFGVSLSIFFVMACGFSFRRDALFLFFLLQVAIYVYLSPLASLLVESDQYAEDYLRLWTGASFLHLLPMLVVYRIMIGRLPDLSGFHIQYAGNRAIKRFSYVLLGMLLLYYVRAFTAGYFFRRIGTEFAAELFASLSYFDLVLIKFHDLVAPAVMLVSLILWRSAGAPKQIKIVAAAFAADMLVFALLNSRITLVSLFVLSAIALLWTGIRVHRLARWAPALVVMFAYLLITLMRFRSASLVGSTDFLLAMNPFGEAIGPSQATAAEWIDRTNCLDLVTIARFGIEGAKASEVWQNPFVSLFGPLIGSPEAMYLKTEGLTTAKAYILSNFTHIPQVDYPSCSLTDAYAGMSMLGFVVAGIVQGLVFGLITRSLVLGGSGFRLLATVVAAFYFMLFEQEFFGFSVGWVKVLPVLLILGPMIPVRRFVSLGELARHRSGVVQEVPPAGTKPTPGNQPFPIPPSPNVGT
jgi:hypothetical protein